MLLPAAASYSTPATLDVESAYRTYHALWPRHTLDTWSITAPFRVPGAWPPNEDPPNEDPPNEDPPNEDPPRIVNWYTPPPPPPLDTWYCRAPSRIPEPEQVHDDEGQRWPDEWPPNYEPPRIERFDTPPPPYTELLPARPADRQQVRKKLVWARRRCLGPLKPKMAAFRHLVKTQWLPAMYDEFNVFLGYLVVYDRDGKPPRSLGLNR